MYKSKTFSLGGKNDVTRQYGDLYHSHYISKLSKVPTTILLESTHILAKCPHCNFVIWQDAGDIRTDMVMRFTTRSQGFKVHLPSLDRHTFPPCRGWLYLLSTTWRGFLYSALRKEIIPHAYQRARAWKYMGAAPNFHACADKSKKFAHAHVGVHEA